jgi:integrase
VKDKIDLALINRLKREHKNQLPEKRYEIRDSKLPGFLLRVEPSGRMAYCMVYARGKRVTIGTSDSLEPAQARAMAEKYQSTHALVKHGHAVDPLEQRRLEKAEQLAALKKLENQQRENYLTFLNETYRPFLEGHLRNGVNNADSVKETMANLINRFPDFHKLTLAEISAFEIDKWKQGRIKEGRKAATVNRQMNDLRACLNKAVEWELLEKNPFEKVRSCKSDSNAKVRHLSPAEEARLRSALAERERQMKSGRERANKERTARGYAPYTQLADYQYADHLAPAILVSLNTGMRRGELLNLTWRNVDLEQRNITVEADTAKGAKTRHIRLNDEAVKVLRTWRDQPGAKSLIYVFSNNDGQPLANVRKSWVGILKRAGIENFRWHDLRHTFASNLVIAGVDLNKVRALLGHTDYKMTLRYAHLAPEHMQEAVDKLVTPAVMVAR